MGRLSFKVSGGGANILGQASRGKEIPEIQKDQCHLAPIFSSQARQEISCTGSEACCLDVRMNLTNLFHLSCHFDLLQLVESAHDIQYAGASQSVSYV